MKDKITTLALFICMLIFAAYQLLKSPTPSVLKVVTPLMLEVDLNGNSLTDENETFCIPDIETFTSNTKYNSERLANNAGLTYGQSLAVGYLTDDFARKTLEGNEIRIYPSDKITPECRYADVFINNENYADMLKSRGYTFKNGKPENPDKFKNIFEKSAKLKLVVLNHRSLKYHTPDCKYGKAARDTVVVLLNEIPQEVKPCKFCHVDKHATIHPNSHNLLEANSITPPPGIVHDGNLQLLMTDFTKILKPDRDCSQPVCKEFVNNINSASKSIDIAAYGWAAIPAVDKALAAAQERNVKIRIVYDTNTKNSNYYPETVDFVKKYENTRSDAVYGSPKITNMLMHNKFAIFDGQKVYTGSMNFSTTGFSGFNHNDVIIINSRTIAEIFEKEFEQMFNGKFHTLKDKTTANSNIEIGNTKLSVYFSPQDKGITGAVIPLVKNSKNYIYIPTFLFTHKALTNELISAHNRGVDVRMIIDSTNTLGLHSAFNELRRSGIPVKVENYAGKMHAKTIIIDDEYLVLGSANFSNSGENKNDENMLVIQNSKLAKAYKSYFEYFWAKIPDKYLKTTVRAESKDSIGSCYDGIDNNFDGKIDNADAGCKQFSIGSRVFKTYILMFYF